MKGRVTVAVASREWAVGGKPIREPAVKKNLKLREEIAWRESRPLPEGLRNRAYSGYPGGRPLEEADVVRYQRMKVVPRELHN